MTKRLRKKLNSPPPPRFKVRLIERLSRLPECVLPGDQTTARTHLTLVEIERARCKVAGVRFRLRRVK